MEQSIVSTNKSVYGKFDFFEEMNESKVKQALDWLAEQKKRAYKSVTEQLFLVNARIMAINFASTYWINKIEPGLTPEGSLKFEPKLKKATKLTDYDLEVKLKEFAPERGSRIATNQERFLYYAWRISQGYITLDETVIIIDTNKGKEPGTACCTLTK